MPKESLENTSKGIIELLLKDFVRFSWMDFKISSLIGVCQHGLLQYLILKLRCKMILSLTIMKVAGKAELCQIRSFQAIPLRVLILIGSLWMISQNYSRPAICSNWFNIPALLFNFKLTRNAFAEVESWNIFIAFMY